MTEHIDALAMQADSLDAEAQATSPQAIVAQQEQDQQELIGVENVGQVRMILDISLPLLGAMYPSLNDVYTEQARAAVAASLGPVLTKYNINLQDWGSAYKEEIGALMVCGPIAWATVQGIKADIAAKQKTEPKAALPAQAPKAVANEAETVRLG